MSEQPSNRRSTRFSMRSKQLGQLLQESGDVKAEHIAKALKLQEQKGGLIGQVLQSMGVCEHVAIANALLKQVQVTDIHCEDLVVAPAVLALVTQEQCQTDKLCPFEKLGSLLCVVMGNPLNRRAINAIEESSRLKVKPFKAPWPRIKELVEPSYANPDVGAASASAGQGGELPAIESLDAAPPTEIPVALDAESPALEPPQPEQALIEGLDDLSDDKAEMIETDGRGLMRRNKTVEDEEPVKAKTAKQAKVNVNLDELDLGQATEVVGSGEESEEEAAEEQLEEITSSAAAPHALAAKVKKAEPASAPARASAPVKSDPAAALKTLVTFDLVPDSYFYTEDGSPDEGVERSVELVNLIEQLPVAEVVAESTVDYKLALDEQAQAASAKAPEKIAAKPVKKEVPLEYKPAPLEPVAALSLSEAEFKSLIAGLDPDPIGEWDWQYAASGPVHAVVYEAEGA